MKNLIPSLLLISSIFIFSGCEKNLNVTQPPKIEESLPVVDANFIRMIPDYESIALEWQAVTSENIKGYHIYRANMQTDGLNFKRIATVKNKFATHYVDTKLQSNSKYSYTISLIGENGFESRPSAAVTAITLPRLEAVSLVDAISNLPRQIKILWRPHPNQRIEKYTVQRTTPTKAEWKKLIVNEGRYNIEHIDEDLGDNETFMYRIIAHSFDDIESLPSETVTATTKPLPQQITSLNATSNLPRMIQVSWGASPTPDVVKYNIYRSTSAQGSYTKVATAPADHNLFDDMVKEDGKIYFYKITAVDKDDLESKLDEVSPAMGQTLGKPRIPQLTLAQIQGEKTILNWIKTDDRVVSYNIYKVIKKDFWSSEEIVIPNVEGLRFEDPDIVRGITYKYSIQAVDKYGLVSDRTKESTLTLPKLENIPQ